MDRARGRGRGGAGHRDPFAASFAHDGGRKRAASAGPRLGRPRTRMDRWGAEPRGHTGRSGRWTPSASGNLRLGGLRGWSPDDPRLLCGRGPPSQRGDRGQTSSRCLAPPIGGRRTPRRRRAGRDRPGRGRGARVGTPDHRPGKVAGLCGPLRPDGCWPRRGDQRRARSRLPDSGLAGPLPAPGPGPRHRAGSPDTNGSGRGKHCAADGLRRAARKGRNSSGRQVPATDQETVRSPRSIRGSRTRFSAGRNSLDCSWHPLETGTPVSSP